MLTALAAGVVEARNDFTQYGATYYFRDLEADASLAASLAYATDLAAEAAASAQPHTRMAGALITAAVSSLTELLDREFLRFGGDTAFRELFGDAVGAMLSARENKRASDGFVPQQVHQQALLVFACDEHHALFDAFLATRRAEREAYEDQDPTAIVRAHRWRY